MTETQKETRVEFATRKLETARRLYGSFGKLLETTMLAQFENKFNELSLVLIEQPEKVDAAVADASKRLFEEVAVAVNVARVEQIRSLVERKLNNWRNSPYKVPFAVTGASSAADEWLKGAASADVKVVLSWIDSGWELLKGQLESPWGKCSCDRNLLPREITDRVTSEKKWVVFKTCSTCYGAEKAAKEAAWNASQGKPAQVAPGARKKAARHATARQRREEGYRSGEGRKKGK